MHITFNTFVKIFYLKKGEERKRLTLQLLIRNIKVFSSKWKSLVFVWPLCWATFQRTNSLVHCRTRYHRKRLSSPELCARFWSLRRDCRLHSQPRLADVWTAKGQLDLIPDPLFCRTPNQSFGWAQETWRSPFLHCTRLYAR